MIIILLIIFVIWVIANFVVPMTLLDSAKFERRFNSRRFTRLDYLLMIIVFPMTILIGTLYAICKYSGMIAGKIAKKQTAKKFWLWLNESPKEKKKK